MGKTLTNIFESNYSRWNCKENVVDFRDSNFSYSIQQCLLNNHTYGKLLGKNN
jgi:hypothetical protein